MTYIAPVVLEKKFTCPHCGAISLQRWQHSNWSIGNPYGEMHERIIRVGTCDHCEEHTLWLMENMLYPDTGIAPTPNSDMPTSVKSVYLEAASIATKSPRGSAALLRLALQLLCKELGEKGKDINNDIAALVRKGLPTKIQQALDIVRVTGNNAVHPGKIDVDSPEVVANLFSLLNVITEYMITMPNKIGGIYSELPAGTHDQINDRDS